MLAWITLTHTGKNVCIDSHTHRVVTIEDGDIIEAFDDKTLVPAWSATPDFTPDVYRVDPTNDNFWLLATGGRVEILSIRTGKVMATIDPDYSKPKSWAQNTDLVIDEVHNIGYVSWNAGLFSNTGVDRISVISRQRSMLDAAAGNVLAVLKSGYLLTYHMNGPIELRDPNTGRIIETVAYPYEMLGSAAQNTQTVSPDPLYYHAVDEDRNRVVIAFGATVPYQNNVSGAMTALGVGIITMTDPPRQASSDNTNAGRQ